MLSWNELCQLIRIDNITKYIAPELDGGVVPTKKSQRSLDTQ
jgi:hypothetical protein